MKSYRRPQIIAYAHALATAWILLSMLLVTPLSAEEPEISFEDQIAPLVDSYCINCHEGDEPKGDLDLLRFETRDEILDSLALWQRVGLRVKNGEMPPKKEERFTEPERELFLKWTETLKFSNEDCDRIATEESVAWYRGYVMSRRLNRREYENTVRDLLGIDIDVAEMFPADGSGGEGFDTNGDALFLSAIQVEKYLEAADLAVEAALPTPDRKPRSEAGRYPIRANALEREMTSEERRLESVRRRLITATPVGKLDAQEAAVNAIEDFIERAWRRPANPANIDRLLALFNRAYDRGDSYETSLKLAYKAALVSPNFIFLAEPEPDEGGVYALGDFPLAAKMSYFIWGSMPDDELFEVARQGKLNDDAELARQVQRMMWDPRAKGLGDLFASQWLGITQLGEITKPDEERFPEFDESMGNAMKEEVSQFFTHIVRKDRSLLELIDSDYTFANEQLATIYGLEGITGEELRKVEFDDPNRGGVLGMAAVLTKTSHPLRTSPVLRGIWVMEQLLGDRIPPPPPNVGAIPEDDIQPDGVTLRARLETHRNKAECASCHDKIDPIGFGLENFDPIGRWRDLQAGQPIDVNGVLPSGEAFSGPQELKAVLMKRKDNFARHISRKMLGYALGRGLTQYDSCVIEECIQSLKDNEYRASTLITEIVLSSPFRYRYSGGTQDSD